MIEVIKKSRLETIAEVREPDNTHGALQIDTDDVIIEAEAENFITLFEKIFTEETEEIDSEDGPAQDILAKIVLKVKEKLEDIEANVPVVRFLRLIAVFFHSFLSKNGKDKSNTVVDASKFMLSQGKNIEVKQPGNVVRQMKIRRQAIFPVNVRQRRYPRN